MITCPICHVFDGPVAVPCNLVGPEIQEVLSCACGRLMTHLIRDCFGAGANWLFQWSPEDGEALVLESRHDGDRCRLESGGTVVEDPDEAAVREAVALANLDEVLES